MNQEDERNLLRLEQNMQRLQRLLEQQQTYIRELTRRAEALQERCSTLESALGEQEKQNLLLSTARIMAADKESAYQIRAQITDMINRIDRGLDLLKAE